MQFAIPQVNLATLADKLAKLERAAVRLGLEPPGTHSPGVQLFPPVRNSQGEVIKRARKLQLVELLGVSPKLPGGFVFCATLEHHTTGNIIRAVPGVEVPEEFRTVEPRCDHCNLTRSRKDTYLVRDALGAWKQVGHSCVANYLGHTSLEQIGYCAEVIKTVRECEDEERFRVAGSEVVTPLEFLEMTCEAVERFGYLSAKSAADNGGTTTAGIAWRQLFPGQDMKESERLRVSPKSEERAAQVLAWVRESMTPRSDYEWNLRASAALEFIEHRQAGILASAVAAHARALGLLAERAKTRGESKHFGEVGKREEFTLTVIKEHTFETSFGLSTVFIMKDDSGNVAKWFTGRGSLDVGTTYRVKATVKAHDSYEGTAQTSLTRVTVIKALEAVSA